MKLSDAEEALKDFIVSQCAEGTRCVLIIHGKGGRKGKVALIKTHTHHWLKQFPQILGFVSALPKHGGTGAVYVLLKKL